MSEIRASVNPVGYMVSDQGDIYSLHNGRYGLTRTEPRPIKKQTYRDGRKYVQLRDSSGKRIIRKVASMVLEAFKGPCPPGLEALHGNGDNSDDRACNLRWGTRLENMIDRENHGRTARGMRNGRCKLSPDQVRDVRTLTPTAAAKKYGITPQHAARIIKLLSQKEIR